MILVFAPLAYIILLLVTLHFSITAGVVLLGAGLILGGSIASAHA